jgi:thiamine-phosphate pyrophosphorylase
MIPSADPGALHVITDETLQDRFSHVDLARLAAEGGADVVQFREKRARSTRELVQIVRRMADVIAGTGARLTVDDRVDVALAVGVRAVHLGRDDLDVATARSMLGDGAVIGATVNSPSEAVSVARQRVDYLGVGPVFGTRSKAHPAPALGLEGLRAIVRLTRRPVVAIGGVTADNAAEALAAGAHGVAVLSFAACSPDPAAAVRRLREAIEAFRAEGVGRGAR